LKYGRNYLIHPVIVFILVLDLIYKLWHLNLVVI
jgi:hypothetical protein